MPRIRGCEITVRTGDITTQTTEAIVNAANSTLLGGGGVDGAIHAGAGPTLLEDCRRIRRTTWPDGLPTGEAVITRGGRLAARFVIHTVGPVWHGGNKGEGQALRRAYTNCLEVAATHGIASVAFPSVSTGAYGYPLPEASRVAVRSVLDFLERREPFPGGVPGHRFREIRFVLFSESARAEFEAAMKEVLAERQDTA